MTKGEALALLQTEDSKILELINAAYKIRSHYFGKKVKLNMIINAKSGHCPENCGYCSQSIVAETPIDNYAWITKEKIIQGA